MKKLLITLTIMILANCERTPGRHLHPKFCEEQKQSCIAACTVTESSGLVKKYVFDLWAEQTQLTEYGTIWFTDIRSGTKTTVRISELTDPSVCKLARSEEWHQKLPAR